MESADKKLQTVMIGVNALNPIGFPVLLDCAAVRIHLNQFQIILAGKLHISPFPVRAQYRLRSNLISENTFDAVGTDFSEFSGFGIGDAGSVHNTGYTYLFG